MENIAYTMYPKRGATEHTRLSLSHSHPNAPRPLPLQTIRNPQAYHRPPIPLYTLMRPPSQTTAVYTPNSMEEAQVYFKDFVHNPEHVYLTTHLAAQQASALQVSPAHFSFRPLQGHQQANVDVPLRGEFKVEQSPTFPTPALLPGSVDASQYENISYPEWLHAPTEYQAVSPSSLDSHADSPATPGDWEPDHSLARSAFSSMQAGIPVCNNFWVTHSHTDPTESNHGLPLTAIGSGFDQPSGVQRISQHHMHGILKIDTAAPQDLSLTVSPPSSNDDIETENQVANQVYESEPEDKEEAFRRHQDDLLLQMREGGYTYGEIKRRGRFREAESTLRGRYRALTKDKLERLRSPQWQEHDIVLLRRAVKRYTTGEASALKTKRGGKKVPWKKIGQWIKDRGGSYLFAPATCAKKWESIQRSPADSSSA